MSGIYNTGKIGGRTLRLSGRAFKIRGWRNQERKSESGQGLVELALLTPMLVLILLGAVDFGRVFSASIQVTNAAREGAYFGARSFENAEDSAAIENVAIADSSSIFGIDPTVSSTTGVDDNGYDFVAVTVTYAFEPLVPYPGIPEEIDLSKTVTMRIIGN